MYSQSDKTYPNFIKLYSFFIFSLILNKVLILLDTTTIIFANILTNFNFNNNFDLQLCFRTTFTTR